jgi:hypothetical protein
MPVVIFGRKRSTMVVGGLWQCVENDKEDGDEVWRMTQILNDKNGVWKMAASAGERWWSRLLVEESGERQRRWWTAPA